MRVPFSVMAPSMLTALASILAGAPIYTITGLGPGTATALNDSGGVAGWSADAFGNLHGFVSDGSGRTELAAGTQAFALGADGSAYGATYDGAGNPSATQWSGSAAGLAGAPSTALGVNDAGVVAGADGGRAVTFSGGSANPVGPSATWSAAYAISDTGGVAGTARRSNGTFGGFVFLPGVGTVWLSTLGGTSSYGAAINDAGAVAGSAQTAMGYLHAVSWSSNGAAFDLGTLGGANSGAYGIGSTGDVVGYSLTAAGDSAAFFYSGGSMMDLNLLTVGAGDWSLEAAYAINGAGQIAGTGLYRGARHAFLLTPVSASVESAGASEPAAVPEPSTSLLFAIPLALLAVPILKRK